MYNTLLRKESNNSMYVMLPLCEPWGGRRVTADVFLYMHRWPLNGYVTNWSHQLLSERALGARRQRWDKDFLLCTIVYLLNLGTFAKINLSVKT